MQLANLLNKESVNQKVYNKNQFVEIDKED